MCLLKVTFVRFDDFQNSETVSNVEVHCHLCLLEYISIYQAVLEIELFCA